MPSNNSKYTQEYRNQIAAHVLESGKSATKVAEELGIDKNTVCSWVREYRREHAMPSYAEEKGIAVREEKPAAKEEKQKLKELEKENRRLKKELEDERENVEILKKSLHIFMQPRG